MSNDPIDNGSKAGQPPRRPRIIACNQKARQLAAMVLAQRGEARACRAAYHYARARLPEGVTVRDLECK